MFRNNKYRLTYVYEYIHISFFMRYQGTNNVQCQLFSYTFYTGGIAMVIGLLSTTFGVPIQDTYIRSVT